jgi:hypothetical protein
MNKKTKMYLGLGVVAVAAYYFWHKSQTPTTTPTTTAKFVGGDGKIFASADGCPAGFTYSINSNNVAVCDNGKGWRYRTNPIR